MRRTLILLISAALVALFALPAIAGGGGQNPPPTEELKCPGFIEIPLTTVARGEPGSTVLLATFQVAEGSQGAVASVEATATNPDSVHPGNDLIISTDGDQLVLPDVEGESGDVTVGSGELTLGSTVTISVRFGEDDTFSAGITVTFTCEPPEEIIFPVASIGGICAPDEETGVEIPAFLVTVQATSPIDNIAVVDDDGLFFGELEGSYAAGESRSQVVAASAVTGPLRLLYASEPIQTLELPPALDCGDEEPATTSSTTPTTVEVSSTVVTTPAPPATTASTLPFTGPPVTVPVLGGMAVGLLSLGGLLLAAIRGHREKDLDLES